MSSTVENMLKNHVRVQLNEEKGLENLIKDAIRLTADENGTPDYNSAYENLLYKLKLVGKKIDRAEFDKYVIKYESKIYEEDPDEEE